MFREDFDKKGEPCQVVDVIWNPDSIRDAKKDVLMRQGMIELAFGYIAEKYKMILDMKFSLPKMKYKGKTIQYQRVRAKKNPKIETLKTEHMSAEDQKIMEEENLESLKQEPVLRTPEWKLYCVQKGGEDKILNPEWIKKQEDLFTMESEVEDEIEEFDGLNDEFSYFVLVAKLEMLMRGYSISLVT